eukprot:Awhi_evm1s2224
MRRVLFINDNPSIETGNVEIDYDSVSLSSNGSGITNAGFDLVPAANTNGLSLNKVRSSFNVRIKKNFTKDDLEKRKSLELVTSDDPFSGLSDSDYCNSNNSNATSLINTKIRSSFNVRIRKPYLSKEELEVLSNRRRSFEVREPSAGQHNHEHNILERLESFDSTTFRQNLMIPTNGAASSCSKSGSIESNDGDTLSLSTRQRLKSFTRMASTRIQNHYKTKSNKPSSHHDITEVNEPEESDFADTDISNMVHHVDCHDQTNRNNNSINSDGSEKIDNINNKSNSNLDYRDNNNSDNNSDNNNNSNNNSYNNSNNNDINNTNNANTNDNNNANNDYLSPKSQITETIDLCQSATMPKSPSRLSLASASNASLTSL